MKIIQVEINRDNDRLKGGRTEVYALCDDGSLFVGRYAPITTEENPTGKGNKWKLYWIELPLPEEIQASWKIR